MVHLFPKVLFKGKDIRSAYCYIVCIILKLFLFKLSYKEPLAGLIAMKMSFVSIAIIRKQKREGSLLAHNILVSLLMFSVVSLMLIYMPVLENSCLGNSTKSFKLFLLA